MRTAILIILCFVLLVAIGICAAPSNAHPKPDSWPASAPGIHKVKCFVWGCKDSAPKPWEPQQPCTWEHRGEKIKEWDEKLGAWVEWICRCPTGIDSCRWFRIGIVQEPSLPWETFWLRPVFDWHRACASIVCKKVAKVHWAYPVIGSYFN